MIEGSKKNLRLKFKLLLKLGEGGALTKEEEDLLLQRERHGRNLLIFSELNVRRWERYFVSDDEKTNSFKGIVLLEKIDEEDGGVGTGSTTITAQICRRIIALNLDSTDLMDFVLANRSSNPYTPFGRLAVAHVKSYAEFREFEREEAQRKFAHALKQRELKEQKKEQRLQKLREHQIRNFKKRELDSEKQQSVAEYFATAGADLLVDILNDKLPFPIFLIPDEEVHKIAERISTIDYETLDNLLRIIPKKSPNKLRELRALIIAQKRIQKH